MRRKVDEDDQDDEPKQVGLERADKGDHDRDLDGDRQDERREPVRDRDEHGSAALVHRAPVCDTGERGMTTAPRVRADRGLGPHRLAGSPHEAVGTA
jgi:hypothetical protein